MENLYLSDIDPTSFRYISHYGILGMKWGVRRYQNEDGTLTSEGREHKAILEKHRGLANATSNAFSVDTRSKRDQRQFLKAFRKNDEASEGELVIAEHIDAVEKYNHAKIYNDTEKLKVAKKALEVADSKLKKYYQDTFKNTLRDVKDLNVKSLKSPYSDEEIKKKIKFLIRNEYRYMYLDALGGYI